MSEAEERGRGRALAGVMIQLGDDCGVTVPILVNAASWLIAAALAHAAASEPDGPTLDARFNRYVSDLTTLVAACREARQSNVFDGPEFSRYADAGDSPTH